MTKPTVIILAGGKSSRFSIIGKNDKNFTPKSLSLINGKSILMNIIEHFLKHGFRKFVIPLGYYKEDFIHKITKEAGNKIKLNLYNKSIDIKDNSPEIFLVKTLKNDNKAERVYKCLKKLGDKDIIVSYGDALGNINLNKMNKIFIQSKKKCLIALSLSCGVSNWPWVASGYAITWTSSAVFPSAFLFINNKYYYYSISRHEKIDLSNN